MTFPRKVCSGQGVTPTVINEIIDCLRAVCPVQGANVRVSRTSGGSVIDAAPAAVAQRKSTHPWSVRYHMAGGVGQWEVFMPPGCISVGRSLSPANPPARDAGGNGEGESDDSAYWMAFQVDESIAKDTGNDGGDDSVDGGGEVLFDVVVHGKAFCNQEGVDDVGNPLPTGYAYVSTRPRGSQTDDDGWGDTYAQTVATVGVRKAGGTIERRIVGRYCEQPISVACRSMLPYELVWWFGRDPDTGCKAVAKKLFCCVNVAEVAGTTIFDDTMTDVFGANEVWLHLVTSADAVTSEIVMDPSSTKSDDTQTWIMLYRLSGNRVVSDMRTTSLPNIQIYR